MLFQRNNSEFGGENKHYLVIPSALIVYSLRFWKDYLYSHKMYLTRRREKQSGPLSWENPILADGVTIRPLIIRVHLIISMGILSILTYVDNVIRLDSACILLCYLFLRSYDYMKSELNCDNVACCHFH